MIEFPVYHCMSSCYKIASNQDSLISDKRTKTIEYKSNVFVNALDPTESMFRSMIGRISTIDKEIKKLTSPNLKQTTFQQSSALKRKPPADANSNQPIKQLKRS